MVTAQRVDRALRSLPWHVRCLERSMLVWWAVGEAGEIRLGVKRPDEGDIAQLKGQTVSLRFTLRNAQFYSYWLE